MNRKPTAAKPSAAKAKATPARKPATRPSTAKAKATPARKTTAKPKPKPKAPAKRKPRSPAKPKVNLAADYGARVLSVFGAFNSRVMIEMSADSALALFPDGIGAASPTRLVEAVERGIAALRERDEKLADSALAADAVALAIEIENPYNSATSKASCSKTMLEALAQLRELAPPEPTKDAVDDLRDRVAKHRGRAAPADLPHPGSGA